VLRVVTAIARKGARPNKGAKMFIVKRSHCRSVVIPLVSILAVIGLIVAQTSCTSATDQDTPELEAVTEPIEEQQLETVTVEEEGAPADTPEPETEEKNALEQQDEEEKAEETPSAEAFIEAVRAGQLEEVQRLLDAGADVNATGNATSGSWWYNQAPAITHAVLTDHSDVVRLLIAHGADLNMGEKGYGDTALHTAAHLNNVEIVKILLESGADPNPYSKHKDWETPLHYAAEAGAVEAIQALVDSGIDVDTRKDQGLSALLNTLKTGRPDFTTKVVTVLLDNGADPNLTDERGNSALHFAAAKGMTEVIPNLIENKANIDLQNGIGDTPLHRAAKSNKVEAVSLLIQYGADLNKENNKGETALDVATRDDIVDILSTAGE